MSISANLRKHRRFRNTVINAALFIGGLAIYSDQIYLWVMAFIILNTYGWILFYLDKKKAQQHSSFRVPESSLFIVSACGGGLGTFLAMLSLRHKTLHLQFTFGLTALMLTSLCIFGYGLWQIIL